MEMAATMFKYVARDRARLSRFLPWVPFIREVEDEKKYIESALEKWNNGTFFDYGVFDFKDNTYMGNIGIHNINWSDEHLEIGYWILGDFEGKGFISEAVLALEKVVFNLGFNRVEIRCDAANDRSASVPKRCGYQLEGKLREDSKNKDGTFRDSFIFAKIKKDLS